MNSRGRRSNGKALGEVWRSRLVTGSMIILEAFDLPFGSLWIEGKQFSLLGNETGRVTGRTMASTFHDVNRFPRGRAGRTDGIRAGFPSIDRRSISAEFRVISAAVNTSGVRVHVRIRKIYINAKLILGRVKRPARVQQRFSNVLSLIIHVDVAL